MSAWTDRKEYAHAHRQRYLDWCGEILLSPYSPLDKAEFAILSAHTPFESSVRAFERSRGLSRLSDIAETLYQSGVIAPFNKAAYIVALREVTSTHPLPYHDYREYRRYVKLSGLGYSKQSFASCLIDPFGSNVVCLDTHMLALYAPTRKQSTVLGSLRNYESVEAVVMDEARECSLPPFTYQWAVWDWRRLTSTLSSPEAHRFLWRDHRKAQLGLIL